MSVRSVFLMIVALLVVSAVPAGAQEKLGDLVAQYGYDWMIGKWTASSGDGHLRTAAAVVRLAAGVDKARLGWLIDKRNVGARAWLVRAYGAPARVRDKHLAKARAVADFSEREDIDAVATWMRGGKR